MEDSQASTTTAEQQMQQLFAYVQTIANKLENLENTFQANTPAMQPSTQTHNTEPSTAPPTISSTPGALPKVQTPDLYHGDRRKLKGFLMQLDIYFTLRPHQFTSDIQKIYFAASYLRGAAFNFFEPYIRRLGGSSQNTTIPLITSYNQFQEELIRTFGDINETATAQRELQKLRQITSAAQYTTEFRRITSHLTWNEDALIFTYYQGLKSPLKDELSKEERPTTLQTLIEKAVRLDDRLFERRMEKNQDWHPTRISNNHFSSATPKHSAPEPMDLDASIKTPTSNPAPQPAGNSQKSKRGKLTPAERKHRMDNNLCLYCGKGGHKVQECYSAQGITASKHIAASDTVPASIPEKIEKVLLGTTLTKTTTSYLNNKDTSMVSSQSSTHLLIPIQLHFKQQVLSTKAMIDSGATGNFISQDLISTHQIPTVLKHTPELLRVIDGTPISSGSITCNTPVLKLEIPLEKSTFLDTISLDIIPMKYPVILGLPWLQRHDPTIDWKHLALGFSLNSKPNIEKTLQASVTPIQVQDPNLSQIKEFDPTIDDISSLIWVKPLQHVLEVAATLGMEKSSQEVILPLEYQEYQHLFDKAKALMLPKHQPHDHEIPLAKGSMPPYGPIYSLSELELRSLREYLDENLSSGFIRPSSSPAGAPILFVKKKDGSLRLCVDYRGLNAVTVKNRYALPLIPELIDRLSSAKIFTKLDLRGAYNLIRIKEGDEWKTAFRTRYGHFEYQVMPFGLANAPASFQALMNDILRPYLDIFVIVYLDDILIYSTDTQEHVQHVRQVLEKLSQAQLFCKLEKCLFHVSQVDFLGHRISTEGIQMDPEKTKAVQGWPVPSSIKEVQSFLGFANYYRRFIPRYTSLALPLTQLLHKDTLFHWDKAEQNAFNTLKEEFKDGKVLLHFDPLKPTTLETDASDFAISGILYQASKDKQAELQPVAFYSRKLSPAEQNYVITDKELLAIVCSLKHWRCYLEGANYPITIYSDHSNLLTFTTTKQLNRRQARWSEELGGFDFVIKHISGAQNQRADLLSRRHDYQDIAKTSNTKALLDSAKLIAASLGNPDTLEGLGVNLSPQDQVTPITPFQEPDSSKDYTPSTMLLKAFKDAYNHDPFAKRTLEYLQKKESSPEKVGLQHFSKNQHGLLLFKSYIYVPRDKRLQLRLLQQFHDAPAAGHFGFAKTYELLIRKFYWPNLRTTLQDYISSCTTCNLNKPTRQKPYGLLQPLPIPERPWDSISIDFIVKLPPSIPKGGATPYDSILVVVDRLTKMAHFEPCNESITASELAWLFLKVVFKYHGIPRNWISDRGAVFTSNFFKEFSKLLNMVQRFSTAYHPQTDGQTERVNSVLEQYLRIYTNYAQDNWADLLHLAEFAYNNTLSNTTKETPFYANYGYHPRFEVAELDTPENNKNPSATERITYLKGLQDYLKVQIQRAQDEQAQAFNRGVVAPQFKVGNQVYLSRRHITTTRPSDKLDTKRLGPFKITRIIGKNAFELALPPTWTIHNVFHASLLSKAQESSLRALQTPPPPILILDQPEYEVESILDRKTLRGQDYFFVKWKGYPASDNTWEPKGNLKNASKLISEFLSKKTTQLKDKKDN